MDFKWISLCALGCLALSCQAPEEQKELESLIQEKDLETAICRSTSSYSNSNDRNRDDENPLFI